jgi:two-component system sensor histidine kinase KdpD
MERALLAEAAERAHTKAELEQTRSTLLSAISHDFRTPLATIHAAAATLAQETPVLGSPEMSDLARLIVDESSRLDHLVGNLLDMMRLEAGGLSPALELQPLEEVVGTVLTRLEPLLGPITVDLPDDLPSVLLDSVLLEQLLTNLLENAFRHGGGPVCLGARALEGELAVEVSDAGRGVPEVLRERVFEKFYRPPGTRADGGAGLGLAICRAIVQVHGGRIWVEEVPGGGAAFRFTLPLPAAP